MNEIKFDIKNNLEDRALSSLAAAILASKDYELLENPILEWFKNNPSKFSKAALQSPLESFELAGWEKIYADVSTLIEKGRNPTAIGIDLTDHWEGDSPGFEVSIYDDDSYPFSTSQLEDIAKTSSAYCPAWTGNFIQIDFPLRSEEPNALYQEVARYEHKHWHGTEEIPDFYQSYLAAVWLLYLRICQSVEKSLKSLGMPKKLIVVMGEHDFGPWFGTAFLVEESDKLKNSSAEFIAQKNLMRAAEYQSMVNNEIAEVRELYRLARMFPFFRISAHFKFVLQLNSALHLMCTARNLPNDGVNWAMKKPDFEAFLKIYVTARKPESIPDALDTKHVDLLHETYLKIAAENQFNIEKDKIFSLFTLNLAHAWKFGGKGLQKRWQSAPHYVIDK